jgi:hypothetical protein
MKFSYTEKKVIQLLQTGKWELAISFAFKGGAYVQEGGIGRGGKIKTIFVKTIESLLKKGLIERNNKSQNNNFHTTCFKLTEKGNNLTFDL